MKNMYFNSVKGVCPVCGSEELAYGDVQSNETGIFYPWRCEKCKSSGKECYTLKSHSHQDVTRGPGYEDSNEDDFNGGTY